VAASDRPRGELTAFSGHADQCSHRIRAQSNFVLPSLITFDER
jgi:hypothetical protein